VTLRAEGAKLRPCACQSTTGKRLAERRELLSDEPDCRRKESAYCHRRCGDIRVGRLNGRRHILDGGHQVGLLRGMAGDGSNSACVGAA
jgi:hypothetical protein